MAKGRSRDYERLARGAVAAFWSLTPRQRLVVLGLIATVGLVVVVVYFVQQRRTQQPPSSGRNEPGTYLFCFWNVQELYDDQDDPNCHDEEEDGFAADPAAFALKSDRIAEALLRMNGGKGPDVAALCEVESLRAMEAVREALNRRLESDGKSTERYETVVFLEDRTGRRFAPGFVTRLPVQHDRTRKLGKGGLARILEAHVVVNKHELALIAAHWTSRVERDRKGGDGGLGNRAKYADSIYGRFRAIAEANPEADVLVCGDFNDELFDPAVREHLHALPTEAEVRDAIVAPKLLALAERIDTTKIGSIRYRGKWQVFDHVCVSRGMLDAPGWSADPSTFEVYRDEKLARDSDGGPRRYARRDPPASRGYSDHFPVTVRLRVQ